MANKDDDLYAIGGTFGDLTYTVGFHEAIAEQISTPADLLRIIADFKENDPSPLKLEWTNVIPSYDQETAQTIIELISRNQNIISLPQELLGIQSREELLQQIHPVKGVVPFADHTF